MEKQTVHAVYALRASDRLVDVDVLKTEGGYEVGEQEELKYDRRPN